MSNRSSRNGTPLPDVEHLELASNHSSPTPTTPTTMTQETTANHSSQPSSAPTTLSFSFSKGSALQKPSAKPPSKLSNSVITIDDEDSDDDTGFAAVTHLEDGAIIGERRRRRKEDEGPLVIKPPETHGEHWLQRRLKMFRPDIADAAPEGVDLSNVPDTIGNDEVEGGLRLPQQPIRQKAPTEQPIPVDEPEKSEDDLARELLLQRSADPSYNPTAQPLIIAPRQPLSEAEVYARDVAHLSDVPTLETYTRVPVEAFGKGILLGLGWKQGTDLRGQKIGKLQEQKKRPDNLGLGAKDEEFLRIDPATGKKISRRDGLGASWNPLKKIDSVTGETIEDGGSGKSTPRREGSRRSSPGHERRDDDRDKRRDKYRSGEQRDSDREPRRRDRDYELDRRRDREYDSDRERKRKDRDEPERDRHHRRDREYDSDYERKRRRENGSSHRSSRAGSPPRKRS
jgi:G-patch domain